MSKTNANTNQELLQALNQLLTSSPTMRKVDDASHLKLNKKRVRHWKRECVKEANRIETLKFGHASVVLPSILRCIIRQLDIVLYNNLPVEAQASACRILFELRDHTMLMAKEPSRISKFLAERWFNERDVLKSLQEWQSGEFFRKRQEFVETEIRLSGFDLESSESTETAKKRAKLNGREKERIAVYQLLCLYCHATGMLAAEEYQTVYQNSFIFLAQTYAGECLNSVRQCVDKLQVQSCQCISGPQNGIRDVIEHARTMLADLQAA